MRHEFDPVGPHRDRPDVVIGLLRTLGSALERISAEHAIPPDPAAFSDDLLRQELALIATADVVDTFFGMWKRSAPAAGSAGADPVPQIGFDPAAAAAFLDRSFPGLFAAADIAIFDPSTSEADRRRRVAEVVLPYIQRRESRKEIARTLATQLGGDPALVESLLADIRLVKDPTVAGGGTPLVEAYLAAVGRGVTIRYFGSVDGSGPILQDPSVLSAPEFQSAPAQAKSARIEGFVEVPEGGLFHFWAKADGVAAEVALRFGGMSTPALLGKVATSGQEIQGQVQLKPGVLMPFTLDIHNLGTGCALSVEGPSLPRGSCDRLLLRPQGVFDRLERAQVLLSKVLGLTGSLGLSEREVRYIATYPDDFEGFAFATLPSVQASMPPTASAASGRQLLSLAEYVLCRRVLNVGSEEMASLLDGISRTVATSPNLDSLKEELLIDLCEALGQAMRRPPTAVRRLIEHFGFTVESTGAGAGVLLRAGRLAKPHALLRLLRGLEIAARIGVSADTLVGSGASAATTVKPAWAQPIPGPAVDPNPGPQIARGIRDGVRALYDAATWRRVAQPISDRLRRRKRDSLVAFIMEKDDFRSVEEMFEYFLLDPGMEPVVYTSRIQLAIASVQTFIQRCFLNLESQAPPGLPSLAVPPSALDAEHWQSMKRYRIWEANRKIFLFPENWLEPEFRDDKSYLFEELESALLQGDVSDELVEDAFLKYLKGLDQIARLEIVSCSADEVRGTLHVLGRTHDLPRKYLYRKNEWASWFPWEPVSADIQGDHVVPVLWRKRLHLFWVTFLEKGNPPTDQATKSPEDLRTTKLSTMLVHGLEAQLNWVERLDGKWVGRGSSPSLDLSVSGPSKIDLGKVSIHATTTAPDAGPVVIHLGGGLGKALRLASKNAVPTIMPAQPLPSMAFFTSEEGPTYRRGAGPLLVKGFASRQVAEYGRDVSIEMPDVTVLGTDDGGGRFEIVPVAHRVLSSVASGTTNHISLHRLYSPSTGDHFYTTSDTERDFAISIGYTFENVACEVFPVGHPDGIPLYRLYHPSTGDHFYTTSAGERDNAHSALGYSDEGVACHVPSGGDTVPLYRASRGEHFYTTSLAEKNNAVTNLGYVDEGIACNVFPPAITARRSAASPRRSSIATLNTPSSSIPPSRRRPSTSGRTGSCQCPFPSRSRGARST